MPLRRALIVLVLSLARDPGRHRATPDRAPRCKRGAVAARTPDGRPDLQGVWHYATATPLERFPEFADRAFITEEEAAAWLAKQLAIRNTDLRNKENPSNDLGREVNEFWWERPAQMAESMAA